MKIINRGTTIRKWSVINDVIVTPDYEQENLILKLTYNNSKSQTILVLSNHDKTAIAFWIKNFSKKYDESDLLNHTLAKHKKMRENK